MNNNIKNINYLPSMEELKEAFPLADSFKTNSDEFPYLHPEFTKLQHDNNIYQVYTSEFINSLSKYIAERIEHYFKINSQPVTILEVGAGDGRLSKFISQELSKIVEKNKFRIIPTDNKDWENKELTNKSSGDEVINIDYKYALNKFALNPTIVLSCWMNLDVDWTPDFRASENVKEYILIGDLFRTAYYGKAFYLPENTNFIVNKLSDDGIIKGLLGRFDGSPHNPISRTLVYSYIRK